MYRHEADDLQPFAQVLRGLAEALLCASASASRLDLTVTRRRRRHEIGEKVLRHMRDLVDRALEDGFVRLRRLLSLR